MAVLDINLLQMQRDSFEDFYNNSEQYLRNVSVDNVIFGYHDRELKVLLQKPYSLDKWTVTGGYIKRTESIEEAANRIAFWRTGLENLYFHQFRSFGNPKRTIDPGFTAEKIKQASGIDLPADFWIFDYFVSVGFYTLTEYSKVELKKGAMEEEIEWWPVTSLPPMMFDHKVMVSEALKSLRLHIAHNPIGYELLPAKFTLPEIHSLYETILGKTLDARNFAKRLMLAGIVIKLNETKKIGAHRSPFLYTFDKKVYDEKLKSGLDLAF
jgi:8-oxo-dGTP diphosphatase